MYNIAIIEDSKADRDNLIRCLKKYEEEYSENFKIDIFVDGLTFISDYNATYDIVFMDIEMPYMDGMRASEKLREIDEYVNLIFVTNMAQYAIKGYEVNAKYFILKPIDYFNLKMKLQKVLENCDIKQDRVLKVKVEEGYAKVHSSKILFLKSDKHTISIFTDKGIYLTRSSMKEMEGILPEELFVRCDNSYMVNLVFVSKVNQNTVTVGKYEVPVSRAGRKKLVNAFTQYLGDIR